MKSLDTFLRFRLEHYSDPINVSGASYYVIAKIMQDVLVLFGEDEKSIPLDD